MKPIDLKVEVLGYGPRLKIDETRELDSQGLAAMASKMTYKDKNARDIALDAINNLKEEIRKELEEKGDKISEEKLEEQANKAFDESIRNSLINSAGRGHASLSTSVGVWCLFTEASKFVDSMFTGAIYSSSLMPSGRRIPVNIESIVAPESIMDAGPDIQKIYFETSKNNIEFYEFLVNNNLVKKEEAAKITPYGIAGGGFIFLPLETIIGYKHEFEIEREWTPQEGHEFISQIESQLKDMGMDILYWARNFAPRNTLNYPNIFTDPKKGSLVKNMSKNLSELEKPVVKKDFSFIDDYFNEDALNLIRLSKEITRDEDSIKRMWRELLLARKDFVKRYNGVISFSSLSDVSWRVWGEVKRHRTLEQSVESVYNAINDAWSIIHNNPFYSNIKRDRLNGEMLNEISKKFIIPEDVETKGLTKKWVRNFTDSVYAYADLIMSGIPAGDAVALIPRGLKLSVFKRFNLYNLMDGYIPLRLCGTAEPEMRRTTEIETEKILSELDNWDSSMDYRNLSKLIGPKCSAPGFCLEPWKNYCGKVKDFIGIKYSKKFHDEIDGIRKGLIYRNL